MKRSLHWPYDSNEDTKIVELYVANDNLQVCLTLLYKFTNGVGWGECLLVFSDFLLNSFKLFVAGESKILGIQCRGSTIYSFLVFFI